MYAPEAFTQISQTALRKLRAAHRYLFMKLIGWNGIESYEEESSLSSVSIATDDSNEEYYDSRSRWLYACAAGLKKSVVYSGMAHGRVEIEFLHPAPTVESQLRKARFRIARVVKKLGMDLPVTRLTLSKSMETVLAPG